MTSNQNQHAVDTVYTLVCLVQYTYNDVNISAEKARAIPEFIYLAKCVHTVLLFLYKKSFRDETSISYSSDRWYRN